MTSFKYLVPSTLLMGLLSAGTAQAAYVWADLDTVDRYMPTSQVMYIHMNNTMINPAGCVSDYYYAVDASDPNFDEYKRMSQTAIVSGKRLRIAIEDTQGDCQGSYPKINRMYMQD